MVVTSQKTNERLHTTSGEPGRVARVPLRVLMVEDSAFDAELLLNLLRRGGYDPKFERIETAEEFRSALLTESWDVILADYNLPQFSAPDALAILKETRLDLPFIVVSGGIGENTAVAAMKAGAHDYLMKDNLARLVPAVERELREAENRAAKRKAKEALQQSELRYRLLWETASDAIVLIDTESKIHFANPAVEQVFGYKPEEVIGKRLGHLQPEDLRDGQGEGIEKYLKSKEKTADWRATETVGLRKDGSEIPIELAFSAMEFDGKRWFVGFIRDVSERKRTERELEQTKEQFRVAREIQQHLFPKTAPHFDGFEIAGATYPAEATGGDYYDYLQMLNGHLAVVVGDVSGHGVGPALLMAETRAYLRILARNRSEVADILTRANIVLAEDIGGDRYVTILLAQINPETRQMIYVNAGHPSGFVLGKSGEIKKALKRTGIPLGIRSETSYKAAQPIDLESGDIVILLTDGFEEAVSSDDHCFGIDRALDVVRAHASEPAEAIVHALYDALRAFTQDTTQEDDLTVIVVKVK